MREKDLLEETLALHLSVPQILHVRTGSGTGPPQGKRAPRVSSISGETSLSSCNPVLTLQVPWRRAPYAPVSRLDLPPPEVLAEGGVFWGPLAVPRDAGECV